MSHVAYGHELHGIWTFSIQDFANNTLHSRKDIIKDAKYYKGESHNKDYQAVLNWSKPTIKEK